MDLPIRSPTIRQTIKAYLILRCTTAIASFHKSTSRVTHPTKAHHINPINSEEKPDTISLNKRNSQTAYPYNTGPHQQSYPQKSSLIYSYVCPNIMLTPHTSNRRRSVCTSIAPKPPTHSLPHRNTGGTIRGPTGRITATDSDSHHHNDRELHTAAFIGLTLKNSYKEYPVSMGLGGGANTEFAKRGTHNTAQNRGS